MKTKNKQIKTPRGSKPPERPQLISEKRLAQQWDCHRSTVARLLERAGVRPYYMGYGRNGLKRYSLHEVQAFVEQTRASLPYRGRL